MNKSKIIMAAERIGILSTERLTLAETVKLAPYELFKIGVYKEIEEATIQAIIAEAKYIVSAAEENKSE